MRGDQFVLQVDLRQTFDPLFQFFNLDHALALHVGQKVGELLVRGLLDVERPVGLRYHVDSEEIAAQHGQLHFPRRRLPRLMENSDLMRFMFKNNLFGSITPRYFFGVIN